MIKQIKPMENQMNQKKLFRYFYTCALAGFPTNADFSFDKFLLPDLIIYYGTGTGPRVNLVNRRDAL